MCAEDRVTLEEEPPAFRAVPLPGSSQKPPAREVATFVLQGPVRCTIIESNAALSVIGNYRRVLLSMQFLSNDWHSRYLEFQKYLALSSALPNYLPSLPAIILASNPDLSQSLRGRRPI